MNLKGLEKSGSYLIGAVNRHFSGVTNDNHYKPVMMADYLPEIRNSHLQKALKTHPTLRFPISHHMTYHISYQIPKGGENSAMSCCAVNSGRNILIFRRIHKDTANSSEEVFGRYIPDPMTQSSSQ
jgi:hypothetical protein